MIAKAMAAFLKVAPPPEIVELDKANRRIYEENARHEPDEWIRTETAKVSEQARTAPVRDADKVYDAEFGDYPPGSQKFVEREAARRAANSPDKSRG
jgi:hypothetical protein